MTNPEDQATETQYQEEETMLLDDKPYYFHPSNNAKELAESIYKLYGTAPQYDYYWLIGELGDFERKTLGLKTNEENRQEFYKRNNITPNVSVGDTLSDEEIELLTSFNPNWFNYTLPHLIRRYISWPMYSLKRKLFNNGQR